MVGLHFNEKTLNLISVSLWIYTMTKCGQSGNKIVYNHNNEDYIITGVENVTCQSTTSALLTS